jgi:hypothetical protein
MPIDCKVSSLGWRKLDNDKRKLLYFLPVIDGMSKWRIVRWVAYVKRKGETSNAYKDFSQTLEGQGPHKGLGVDRRIVVIPVSCGT